MTMQVCFLFAFLRSYKIFRAAVNSINVLKLPSDVFDFLAIFNQIRNFVDTLFITHIKFHENPSTGSHADTCKQTDGQARRS